MQFQRFEVPGLAHYSYLLSSQGKAVVVDPKRDIDTYLTYAAEHGLSITHVLETHIHADYASAGADSACRFMVERSRSGRRIRLSICP